MGIPTPHIEVTNKDDFAKTVLMPGDPLRAKFIAETFLEDVVQVNSVRNALAYTGTYKGRRISVFGSGMGMPSIGIYSYELYSFYDVENIIRIGSCGAYSDKLNLYDVLLVQDAWSESTYAKVQSGYKESTIEADKDLNNQLATFAAELDIPLTRVRIHSSDVFYRENFEDFEKIRDEEAVWRLRWNHLHFLQMLKYLEKKPLVYLLFQILWLKEKRQQVKSDKMHLQK